MKRPAPVFWRGAFVFLQFIPHSDDLIALSVIKFTALKKHEVPFPVTKPIPAQIVWFKRDLRLHDHEPLVRALQTGPVLPLYIIEPSILYAPDFDASHYLFVRQSLRELREELANLGQPLIVRQGEAIEVLEELRAEGWVAGIWAHEETGNGVSYQRDRGVRAWAKTSRVPFCEIPSGGVVRRLKSRDSWIGIRQSRMGRKPLSKPSALHLAKLFLDYEPGIHYSQFQMQSGTTGINTVRIYNPTKQARDRDADGAFIRRWVPELQSVPAGLLATPWLMSQSEQLRAGCFIGETYPAPIVDHDAAIKHAKSRIYEVRNRPETQRLADEIRFKHGSRRPVFNGRLKEMRWNGQLRMDFQEEGQLTLAGNSR